VRLLSRLRSHQRLDPTWQKPHPCRSGLGMEGVADEIEAVVAEMMGRGTDSRMGGDLLPSPPVQIR
jgi:hypothetical protein